MELRCPTSRGVEISKRKNRGKDVEKRRCPAQLRPILIQFQNTKNKEKNPKMSKKEKKNKKWVS